MFRWGHENLWLVVAAALAVTAPAPAAAKGGTGAAKRPDLAITKLPTLPAGAAPGQKLALTVTVANKGKKKSGKSKLAFRLSTDRTASGKDLASGKGEVGGLKPKEKKNVTVKMTVPAGAKGSLYLIACVSKVKGEPGGNNNCLAPSRPTAVKPAGAGAGTPAAPAASPTPADPEKTPTPPADPPGPPDPPSDPTFPERFVGTASAQHTDSRTVTPTGPDPGDTLGSTTSWKSTLTADVVFTRRAAQGGGYQYVSTGDKLKWRIERNDQGGIRGQPGQQDIHQSCIADDNGETAIGPFGVTRFASATLVRPATGSMGPGGQYNLVDAWDFAGLGTGSTSKVFYTEDCTSTGPSGGPPQYSRETGYEPTPWLPSENFTCDPTPGQVPGRGPPSSTAHSWGKSPARTT